MMNDGGWDLIIRPKRKWWDVGLGDIWDYRDLLVLLVKRDIVAFYKQTILGPLWFFIQPMITMSVYLFVFNKLAGLSTNGLPGPIFYLTGIVFWTYFSQSLLKTASTLKSNRGIFSKVYFPRIIMPVSILLSNLFRLFIHMFLLSVVVAYFSMTNQIVYEWSWNLIYFPIFFLLLATQALGFGLMVTAMTTKYRDLVLLLNFGVQLLMYATPVVYPFNSLPVDSRFLTIVNLNPIAYLFEGIRYSIFGAGIFEVEILVRSIGITILVLLCGILVFNRVERDFVDTI
jgi:lipopolysaccharide transport system permease protein